MAKIERIFNVPLRKGFLKAVRYKKTKKAMTTLKEFLAKNMKVEMSEVRVGKKLNLKVWERGIKNPPHHVKVTAIKGDDGIVRVELFGNKYDELTAAEREEKNSGKKPKAEKEVVEKKVEEKPKKESTEKPVEKKETVKKVVKKETESKPTEKKPTEKKTVEKVSTKETKTAVKK